MEIKPSERMAVLPTKFEHKTREAMFPGTPGSEGFFWGGGGQPKDTLTLPGINGQPHGLKVRTYPRSM